MPWWKGRVWGRPRWWELRQPCAQQEYAYVAAWHRKGLSASIFSCCLVSRVSSTHISSCPTSKKAQREPRACLSTAGEECANRPKTSLTCKFVRAYEIIIMLSYARWGWPSFASSTMGAWPSCQSSFRFMGVQVKVERNHLHGSPMGFILTPQWQNLVCRLRVGYKDPCVVSDTDVRPDELGTLLGRI